VSIVVTGALGSAAFADPPAPVAFDQSSTISINSGAYIGVTVTGVSTGVAIVGGPGHGVAGVANASAFGYTPANGYTGPDSFTYVATGPGGTSNIATVSITVVTPPPPTTSNATASTAYQTATLINLYAAGGGGYDVAVASNPTHGTAVASGHDITYTPIAGFFGTDSFTFTSSNSGGVSNVSTVTVTVVGPAAPTAAAKSAAVAYDSNGTAIDLSGSVTGTHTILTVTGGPAHGTTSVSGDFVTYTPATGYYGADSFTYTATGPGGTSSAATVSIGVATPAAPVAGSFALDINYNSSGEAISAGSRVSGVFTAVAITAGPSHGSASVSGTDIAYTPANGYTGPDSITYTATGPGGTSTPATISLTIAVPPPPTATDVTASTAYLTPVTIDLYAAGGGGHPVAVASNPAHGTAVASGHGVVYTPAANFAGTDSFTFTASNTGGTSNAATITVTVAAPAAPAVAARSVAVSYGSTGTAIDLSSAVTGVHTGLMVASAPAHGATSVSGDTITYTPTAGFYGADSFTYTANGAGGTSPPATVSLTVATPPAPTVAAASASTAYNAAKAIDLSASVVGVHTSLAAGTPAHGTTSVLGDTITYTPASGYFGNDSFTYTATGPGGTSAAATISLTVVTPAAPTVAAKSASIGYNSGGTGIDLSASVSGVHTSLTVTSGPGHGAISVSGDTITYTPTASYYGSDSFAYSATGPGGTSSTATVSITVATPAAPTVAAKSAAVPYNSSGTAIDLASSIAGLHSSLAVASGPAHGSTSVAGDVVTYTPTSGYYGPDSFTYTATGPGGTSATATVSVTVATPAAPTVTAASASAGYNGAQVINLASSITGVHASLTIASGPSHGSTSVAGDTVTYTPANGYYGADSFTYIATGPGGTSAAATVSVTVAAPPAPVASGKSASVAYNSSGTGIDLSSSITGVHASVTVTSGPSHGTVSISGDTVTYTPTSGYYGADGFGYAATGPGGTSATAMVTITVATPGAPMVAGKSAALAYNSTTAIDLSANVTGVHTSLAVASAAAHGSTSVAGDVVTYAPASGYYGADSFTYTATGPGGTSATAMVTITVATPAAPTVTAKAASIAYNLAQAIDFGSSIGGVHSSMAVASAPAHGTISVAGDVVTYTPAAGYYGADSFTYTATGPGGTSPAATVSLTVATPPAPTATAKSVSVPYNSSGAGIDLGGSVSGVHSGLVVASTPGHGATSVVGDTILYTPTVGYYGADSFTYSATGPGGTSAAATVSITVVTPAAPTVAAKSASVGYNSGGAAIDLSSSISGIHSSVAIAGGPSHGATSVSGDVVTYTPANGYYGADSFGYAASGPGGTSATATVTITVAPPAAPTAAAKSVSIAYNMAMPIDLGASVGGIHSGLSVASAPAHGSTSVAGDVITYTPASGFYGADSFTYVASGPGGASAAATVTLLVATPGTPAAAGRTVNVGYNTPAPIDLGSAITGVHTSLAVAGAPAHGTTSVSGDVVTYTPASGYSGGDSFPYTATGPGGTSVAATVTLVVATPPAPTVTAKTVAAAYNMTTAIDLSANVGGIHASLAVASAPSHGTAAVTGDVVTYTPVSGYYGPDGFTYTAAGPGGTSGAATVSVTVATPNAPTVSAKSVSVGYNSAAAIDLSTGIGGVHSAIVITSGSAHGSTSVAGDVVTYTPASSYYGADSFAYAATGPGGTSTTAIVTIAVATPGAPTVSAKTVSVAYNTAQAIDLSTNVSGIHQSIGIASAPAHGITSVAGDQVTYTPASGYYGADSFTYAATGPGGTSTAATVTLTVATPSVPTAAAKTVNVGYNMPQAIDLGASIAGVHTSLAIAALPAHGVTTVAGDVVTYTPTSGYSGADSFAYTATGPGGTSAAATVSLAVATPAAPTVAARSANVGYNAAQAIDLSASVTGIHTSIAVATAPAHGTTSVASDVVTYTPAPGYYGADSFAFTATGPGGTSAAATVSLAVATPAAPTVAARSANVGYNAAQAIDLSASVTGVHTSIAVATAPAHGTATIAGDVVTYTPAPGYYGADSFAYTATGPGGTSAAATVSLAVATPAAPTVAAKSANVGYNAAQAIDLSASVTGIHTSIAVATVPAHGTTSVAGDVVTYTPTSGYYGADSFAYIATGPGGTSAAATVAVTVATPATPTATAKAVEVGYNAALAIDLSASIAGVHTGIAIATTPTHGTAAVAGMVVTYTPTAGYYGADSFTYTAVGPGGTSAAAAVTLTIAVPPAPMVAAVSATVGYNASAAPIDVAKSVTGVHGTIAITTAPTHGTTSIAGDVISYTPATGYYGADSLAFSATGPGGTSPPATLGITVKNPPAPTVAAATAAIDFNTVKAIDLSKSVNGVHSALAITTAPTKGAVTIAGDIVTFTPTAGATGSDSFAFTATGPGGTSQPATVTLTIATPPPPTAIGGSTNANGSTSPAASCSVTGGGSTTISLSSLISGEYTAIQIVVMPQHGTLTLTGTVAPQTIHTSALHAAAIAPQATGGVSAVYTPNPGYVGPDSFQFVAVGPGGVSAPAMIAIVVLGSPPVAQPKTASTIDDQSVSVDLSAGATGGPFTAAIVASVTPSDQATVAIVQGGSSAAPTFTLTITPKARYSGQIVVSYKLSNAYGSSTPAAVTVTVTRRPDPSADPTVRALSDAQAEAARQLGRDQIDNFMRRTEQLHGVRDTNRSNFGARLGFDALMSPRRRAGLNPLPDDMLIDHRLDAITDARNADAAARTGRHNAAADPGNPDGVLAFWTGGSLEIGTFDQTTRRAKLDVATVGLSGGADVRIGDRLTVGLGGGYGIDAVKIASDAAHLRATSTVGIAYLSAAPTDGSFIDATAGYGGLDFRTRRLIASGASTALGHRSGNLILGSLSAGIDRKDGAIRWSLYGRGIYERAMLDVYAETGAGLYDLRYDVRRLSSLSGVLGGRIAITRPTGFGKVTPWARGEWTHEFQSGSEQRLDYADIAGAALYGIETEGWRRERFTLSIGSDLELLSSWTFGVEIGTMVADQERAGTAKLLVSRKF
jgi:hypothetical protein